MTIPPSSPGARTRPKTARAGKTAVPLLLLAILAATGPPAPAQTRVGPAASSTASLNLPDAPGFSSGSESEPNSKFDPAARTSSSSATADNEFYTASDDAAADGFGGPTIPPTIHHHRVATLSDMTIQPGQTPQKLTGHQTSVLGLTQSFTFFSAFGWLGSAGYTQLVNGSPNYGVDSGAFGERLGAAALRNTSQNIIGNAVLARLFHQDPRYFKLGRDYGFIHRTAYAVTRVLVTRNDDGDARINFSLLGGHLAGAALTNLYYPPHNQGFSQTGKTFGNALGGAAVGYLVTELLDDALDIAHLQRLE